MIGTERLRQILAARRLATSEMPWYGFNYTGPRVCPQRVGSALTLEVASVRRSWRRRTPRFTQSLPSRELHYGEDPQCILASILEDELNCPARLFRAASFVRPWRWRLAPRESRRRTTFRPFDNRGEFVAHEVIIPDTCPGATFGRLTLALRGRPQALQARGRRTMAGAPDARPR